MNDLSDYANAWISDVKLLCQVFNVQSSPRCESLLMGTYRQGTVPLGTRSSGEKAKSRALRSIKLRISQADAHRSTPGLGLGHPHPAPVFFFGSVLVATLPDLAAFDLVACSSNP